MLDHRTKIYTLMQTWFNKCLMYVKKSLYFVYKTARLVNLGMLRGRPMKLCSDVLFLVFRLVCNKMLDIDQVTKRPLNFINMKWSELAAISFYCIICYCVGHSSRHFVDAEWEKPVDRQQTRPTFSMYLLHPFCNHPFATTPSTLPQLSMRNTSAAATTDAVVITTSTTPTTTVTTTTSITAAILLLLLC